MNKKTTLVFVCIENACRSQMAEAFAKILKKTHIEVYSAGSRPAGKINKKAIDSMKTLGYDLSRHTSTGINALPKIIFDWLVTMGCGDQCPSLRAKNREHWDIPDPKHMDAEGFDLVRDLIGKNVAQFIETMQNNTERPHKTSFHLRGSSNK